MSIAFTCTNCTTKLRIDDSKAGLTVACPKCQSHVRIPSPVPTAPTTTDETQSVSQSPKSRDSVEKAPPKPSGETRRGQRNLIALSQRAGTLVMLFKPFQKLLIDMDRSLVYVATPFGVRVRDSRRRYAVLLGIYALIYFIGLLPIPVLPLVVLTIGYIGVLAVGRAWVLNEKERTLIAKKLKEGNPDEMPDLRWTALVSALQLLILFPLIFRQVQWHFGLYMVPEGTNFWDWTVFTLDSYNKAFLNLLEVYGVHVNHITYESIWGRHLVTLCRLTFDFLLIQGIFRLLTIREMVRDAVAAVKTDVEMPVRIGRRAVEPLIELLKNQDFDVRCNAAMALGDIGDARAVPALIEGLEDNPMVFSALGKIGDARTVPLLLDGLRQGRFRKLVNEECVMEALGDIGDARAVPLLIEALKDALLEKELAYFGHIRTPAEALGKIGDTRALPVLLDALKHQDWAARQVGAEALGKLGDDQAVPPLIEALTDNAEAVRNTAAKVLGDIGDARAVPPLIEALKDDRYLTLPCRVAEALGKLGDPRRRAAHRRSAECGKDNTL